MFSSSFHIDSLELASLLEIKDRFRKESLIVTDVKFCLNLGSTFTAATESLLAAMQEILIVISLVAFQNFLLGFKTF